MRPAVVVALTLSLTGVPGAYGSPPSGVHWVASWAASPSSASPNRDHLTRQTVRMIVSPHLGGRSLRLHLSNRFGSRPITLGPVTVAAQAEGATLVPGSVRRATFHSAPVVRIRSGSDVVSDRVPLRIKAFRNLAISVAIPGHVASPTEHFTTRQTNYLTPTGSGDHAADVSAHAFSETATTDFVNGWYFLAGVDVVAAPAAGVLVSFGDSITDGFQGRNTPLTEDMRSVDKNQRYPDFLARRLAAAGGRLSVVNAGIGGNRILRNGQIPSFGRSGLSRFRKDALKQAGVRAVLILEGINDIGQTPGITAGDITRGLATLVKGAHRAGTRALLGTITPAGGTLLQSFGGARANAIRKRVNFWVRSQHLADGVVDFDAAVRDPFDPSRLRPAYDGSDHLHLSPAGNRAMAKAVNLRLLRRAGARSRRENRRSAR